MTTFQIDWSKVDTSYWRDHPNQQRSEWLWPGYHCNKDKKLQYEFGITCGDYYTMYDAQGGRCRICGKEPQEKALDIDVDHYDPSIIYGLLCSGCNRKNTQEIKEHIKHPLGAELGIKANSRKVLRRHIELDKKRKRTQRVRARNKPQALEPVSLDESAEEAYLRAIESSR